MCGIDTSPWANEDAVCATCVPSREGMVGTTISLRSLLSRSDQYSLAHENAMMVWGQLMPFMTLITWLFPRMAHNCVCVMFSQESIQIMHLCQEYQ